MTSCQRIRFIFLFIPASTILIFSFVASTANALPVNSDNPAWNSLPTLSQITTQLANASSQTSLTSKEISGMQEGAPYPDTQENGSQKNCEPTNEKAFAFAPCVYGDRYSKRVIAVVGDSEADMWIPTLDIYGKEFGYKVERFVMDGCIPWKDKVPASLAGWTNCEVKWKTHCINAINKLRPYAVVVAGMVQDSQSSAVVEDPALIATGIDHYFSAIKKSGAKLFMLSNIPWEYSLPSTPSTCVFIHNTAINACDGTVDSTMGAAIQIVNKSGLATVVPVHSLFCSNNSCPIVVGKVILYADNHHMSHSWATYIPNAFSQIFNPLLRN